MGEQGRPKNIDILYKQAQTNFTAYNMVVNGIGRADPWKASPFHHYLCQRVQKFIERESTKPYEILIISTPPQHGKSLTVSETLPSWYLGKYPEKRVLEVSYNTDFAQRFGKKNKEKIEAFGGEIFGIKLSKSTKSSEEWELDNNVGGMKSCGFNGSIAGRKGNLIIIDDPIKNRAEASSETYRRRIWESWKSDIKTRTHPGSKIILIMTRWHEDDLAGKIIENERNLEIINLPLECNDVDDLLGRKIGDSLCPEIGKDNEWMQEFKRDYISGKTGDKDDDGGISAWYSLFQGSPVVEGGNLIKNDWWQYYELPSDTDDKKVFLSNLDELLMSVDCAFKDTLDPVCIQVWGRKKADLFLIDMINDRIDFTQTVKAIQGTKTLYPQIRTILVEDKANGSAVISTLRHDIPGIIPIQPLGGKISRVQAVSPTIESGNLYLPTNKRFTTEFVAQCSAFPNGKHDDMVDAMSQAITRMSKHRTHEYKKVQPGIMDFFGKSKSKTKDKAGRGEKVNVI